MHVALERGPVEVVLDALPAVLIGQAPRVPTEFDYRSAAPDKLADGIASVEIWGGNPDTLAHRSRSALDEWL